MYLIQDFSRWKVTHPCSMFVATPVNEPLSLRIRLVLRVKIIIYKAVKCEDQPSVVYEY